VNKTREQIADELMAKAGFSVKPKAKGGEKNRVDNAPAVKQPLHDRDTPDWSILDDRRGELPEFPLDCLGERVRAWVERAARGAGVTVAHVAVPALGIASSLVGMSRRVKATTSWLEPVTCWTAVVGASGTGKTPGIETVKRALAQIERNNRNKVAELQRKHEAKAEAARAARARWKKQVEEATEGGAPLPSMPENAMELGKFVAPRRHVSDGTIERFGELLQARPQGVLRMTDELSAMFMNISRYSGGQDNEFWLEAWNGGAYTVERINRTLRINHLLIGVVGGMQPDKLAESFEGPADGMYTRLLFAWPPEPAYQPLSNEALEVDPDILNALTRLDGIAEFEDDNLLVQSIELSMEAVERFEQFRRFVHLEKESVDGREREWLAKAPAHVLRLAGALCLLDWAMRGGAEPTEIGTDFISAAIRLVQDYFWPHAKAALRQVGLTEKHVNARRALRWMRARGRREISIKDVRRDALGERLDAEQTADLLRVMTGSGWLREKESTISPIGGRPARRWEVNPILFLNAETAETAQTPRAEKVLAVPAVSAPHSVLGPEWVNGGGDHRQNDLEDCPLAPDSSPDDSDPEGLRGLPESKGPAAGPPDDSLDIPYDLQRCQHCGKPGAKRWNVNGRAVFLHEGCSHAWADRQERTTHSDRK
jgi:Protein of unknown function (DUF3987)